MLICQNAEGVHGHIKFGNLCARPRQVLTSTPGWIELCSFCVLFIKAQCLDSNCNTVSDLHLHTT